MSRIVHRLSRSGQLHLAGVEETLLAVLWNGELLSRPLATLAWRQPVPEIKGISAVAMLKI